MTGEAFQMRYRLARLAEQHGITPGAVTVPLSDPIDHPVIVEGFASTTDVDLTRQKFRPYAFINPCTMLSNQKLPPVYYKHDQFRGAVGEILELKDGVDRLRRSCQRAPSVVCHLVHCTRR